MTKSEAINDFFMTALKGESKTYNDHNWYNSGGLKGYIQGQNTNPYPLLKKALSEYTIGEVKAFQARPRDASGQLWATGRYQIIPSTLKGVQAKLGLPDSAKYNEENQDKLAFQLLMDRPTLSKYIKGTIADSTANLQKASLEMSMIWSSIGIPYAANGKQANQSYYSHDKASVKSETVQAKLQELRNNLGGKLESTFNFAKKNYWALIIGIVIIVLAILLIIYRKKIVSYITNL
jgi:muramidase (phage lysozyme)